MGIVREVVLVASGVIIGTGLAYVHAQSVTTTQIPIDTSKFASSDAVAAVQSLAQSTSALAASAQSAAQSAQSAASAASTTAAQAQSTAQAASTAASSAQGTAQSASQAAASAATAAGAAQTAATSAGNAATAAQTTATAAQGAAASAATAAQAASALASAVPTDYLGIYTLATMPSATANPGKRALVTDLGGGPGYLRATNGCWKRISTTTAQIQTVTVATSVTVDGLVNSPIVGLAGSAFASKATITVTNACSMPQVTIVAPAGVFSALGSLGLSVGGNNLAVAGIGTAGTWNDYAVASDGSSVTKIRGGSL